MTMFRIEVYGINCGIFDYLYDLVLNSLGNIKRDRISVNEFVEVFCNYFGINRVKIKWENQPANDRQCGWLKGELLNSPYYTTRLSNGITFEPREQPITFDKLPGNHDETCEEKKESVFNVVSNPAHYIEGRKYEPRKVIADWELNFNLGNAVKYLSRAGRKGDKIEDLRKAIRYIEFEIEELSEPNSLYPQTVLFSDGTELKEKEEDGNE